MASAILFVPDLLIPKIAMAWPASLPGYTTWKKPAEVGLLIFGLAAAPIQGTPSCTNVGLIAITTPLHGFDMIMKTVFSKISFFAAAMPLASLQAESANTVANLRPFTPPCALM